MPCNYRSRPRPYSELAERPRVVAVPLDRAAQPLLQPDLRCPTGELAQLGGVDPLPVDLTVRGPRALDVRSQRSAGQPADEVDHVGHPMRAPAAGVEGLSPALPGQQRAPQG